MTTTNNRNHFAAHSYCVAITPGACPRTRFGWRVTPAFAKIQVLGRTNYVAALTQRKDAVGRSAGWMASVTVTESCTIECDGRTQMEAAKNLANVLLHDLHGINVDLGPDL